MNVRTSIVLLTLIASAIAAEKKSDLVDHSRFNSQHDHSEKIIVHVSIIGAVKKPGTYDLRASDSVWKAIEAAGGFQSLSTIKFCVNRKPKTGEPQTFFMSLDVRAIEIVPLLLCDGDVIVVPEKSP